MNKKTWDKLWSLTHITPLKIVGKHLFIKPITVQYPEERLQLPPRFIGRHIYDRKVCLGCQACARICPNNAIEMNVVITEEKKRVIDKFTINLGRCMFCGLCMDACPRKAITRGPEFELAATSREDLIYGFERLSKEEEEEEEEEK